MLISAFNLYHYRLQFTYMYIAVVRGGEWGISLLAQLHTPSIVILICYNALPPVNNQNIQLLYSVAVSHLTPSPPMPS